MPETAETHRLELAVGPASAMLLVERVAAEWGADFAAGDPDGGQLRLPVTFGLRRGYVAGSLSVIPGASGSALTFRVDRGDTHLQAAMVGFLALGGLGGVLLMLLPFFPYLVRLAPIAAVLAFGAWFLVVARLHVSGPEEFLARVAEAAAAPPEEATAGEAD